MMIDKIEERDIEELKKILQEGDAQERADAAKALGMIELAEEERVINALVERVKKDEDATVKANAVLAIGHIGDEAGKKALKESAEDEDWEVRHDAAIAMGEYRDDDFIETLYSLLEDDEVDVQKKAIEALGKIGKKEKGKKIISELEKYLEASDLKKEVIKAIGEIGTKKALQPLSQVIENGNQEVREEAIRGIGKLEEKDEVEDILIKALEDESWRIREEAAGLLGEYGNKRAVEPLLEAIDDEKVHVVEESLRSLGALEVENEKILEGIKGKTKDENPSIRIAAAEALSGIDSEDSTQILLDALKVENNPRVLWSISESLSDLSKKNLEKFKKDIDALKGNRKEMVAVTMGKAGFSKYTEDIISLLDDDRWKVRQKAAEALRCIDAEDMSKRKTRRALNRLTKRCEDNDKWVRAESVRALGDLICGLDYEIDTEKSKEKLLKMADVEIEEDVLEAVKYAKDLLDM